MSAREKGKAQERKKSHAEGPASGIAPGKEIQNKGRKSGLFKKEGGEKLGDRGGGKKKESVKEIANLTIKERKQQRSEYERGGGIRKAYWCGLDNALRRKGREGLTTII